MRSKALLISGAVLVVALAAVIFLFFQDDPPEEDDRPPIIVYNGSVEVEISNQETGNGKQWSQKGSLDKKTDTQFGHSHNGNGPARFNVYIDGCTGAKGQKNVRSLQITYGSGDEIEVTISNAGMILDFAEAPEEVSATHLRVNTTDTMTLATLVLPGNNNTKECQNPTRIEIRQRSRP